MVNVDAPDRACSTQNPWSLRQGHACLQQSQNNSPGWKSIKPQSADVRPATLDHRYTPCSLQMNWTNLHTHSSQWPFHGSFIFTEAGSPIMVEMTKYLAKNWHNSVVGHENVYIPSLVGLKTKTIRPFQTPQLSAGMEFESPRLWSASRARF